MPFRGFSPVIHLWKIQISEVDEWVRTGRANGNKSTGSTGKRAGHGE
jgi:hypothetical protein